MGLLTTARDSSQNVDRRAKVVLRLTTFWATFTFTPKVRKRQGGGNFHCKIKGLGQEAPFFHPGGEIGV